MEIGSPAVNNLKNAIRTGGANFLSAAKALSTSMALIGQIWETNPGTTNPWTIPEVNALEEGQQSAT